MTTLRVYWNSVTVYSSGNLKQYSPNSNITSVNLEPGCTGVVFRTLVRQEMDFSGYLKSFSLETDRKSRDFGDAKMMYCPKPETEKSIATLRIVKPKTLLSMGAEEAVTLGAKKVRLDPTQHAETVKEFTILLESTDFLLEEVQEQMAERFQLQETFGDFNVFFFGRRAEIFTYSGTLINAGGDLGWRNNFLYNYENYLRGTKCAELKARAYMLYDDVVREGYILSAGLSQNSVVEGAVKFNFTLLVTGKRNLTGDLRKDERPDYIEAGIDINKLTPNNFEFVRSNADDGGLPWVYPPPEVKIYPGAPQTIKFDSFMAENSVIEGPEPASDLKQAIVNRSLEALSKTRASGTIEEEGQVLDYEILIDFISAKQLKSLPTTAAKIAGQKSTDVENQTGEVIVARLLSDPTLSVGDLRLGEAVKAAESLATNYEATIGREATDKLRSFSEYFAPGSQRRLFRIGPDVSFHRILQPGDEGDRYVLAQDIDKQLVKSVISNLDGIYEFNQGTANDQVVDLSKVLTVDILARRNTTNKVGIHFAAAFCLIEDPLRPGRLIGRVEDLFEGALGLGNKANAVDFVMDQTAKNYVELMQSLPSDANQAFNSALKGLEQSYLYVLALSKAGSAPVYIGDGILFGSTLSGTPKLDARASKYIFQASVYISAIVQELFSKTPVTPDLVGGTLKAGPQEVSEKYFTSDYAATLDPYAVDRFGSGILEFSFDYGPLHNGLPISGDGSGGIYVFVPYGRRLKRLVVTIPAQYADIEYNYTVGKMSGEDDKMLFASGIVHIPKADYDEIKRRREYVYIEIDRRSDVPAITGSTEYISGDFVTSDGRVGNALAIKEPIFRRCYHGGAPLAYRPPTAANLRDLFSYNASYIGRLVSDVVKDCKVQLSQIISDPGLLEKDPYYVYKDELLKSLAVSNFATSTMIAKANTSLEYTGAVVANYIDFAYVVDRQKVMAKMLEDMKQILEDAVSVVRDEETEPANVVRDADNQCRETSCS